MEFTPQTPAGMLLKLSTAHRLTSLTAANLNQVFAHRLPPKVRVKRDHAEDLRSAEVQPLGDDGNRLVRDIAQLSLYVMENRERRSRPPGMFFDNRVDAT